MFESWTLSPFIPKFIFFIVELQVTFAPVVRLSCPHFSALHLCPSLYYGQQQSCTPGECERLHCAPITGGVEGSLLENNFRSASFLQISSSDFIGTADEQRIAWMWRTRWWRSWKRRGRGTWCHLSYLQYFVMVIWANKRRVSRLSFVHL